MRQERALGVGQRGDAVQGQGSVGEPGSGRVVKGKTNPGEGLVLF